MNDLKQCLRCKKSKPTGDFYRDRSRPDGLLAYCKACRDPVGSRYAKSAHGIAVNRNNRLKRKFGIDSAQYDAILRKQMGVCALCRKKCTSGKALAVDHDHNTGAVRGLLCYSCNTGLGKLGDSLESLRAAVAYLEAADQHSL